MPKTLSTNDHDRNVAGLRYVYPVISRRSGGLSIGINFNPNNACNWHCVYCQVPGLQRGNAPEMDFDLLERELRSFLNQVLNGDFYQRFNVPEPQRVIKDIAISGNGEPTSLKNLDKAIKLIGDIASQVGVFPGSRYVLISNGSLINQAGVQQGLETLARYNGELWFKVDSATESGRKLINRTGQSQQKLLEHLQIAAKLCRTKLQTCVFSYRFAWSDQEKQAYLSLLKQLQQMGIKIEQVMLYSLARPSLQAEAAELAKASAATMDALAADARALGYDVSISY